MRHTQWITHARLYGGRRQHEKWRRIIYFILTSSVYLDCLQLSALMFCAAFIQCGLGVCVRSIVTQRQSRMRVLHGSRYTLYVRALSVSDIVQSS